MSIRTERLGAVIQKDLGEILQQDYQQSGSLITVTAVRMTEDLLIAKVYLSVFTPTSGDPNTIYQYLDEHIPEIRKKLAERIRHQVRRIPELQFYVDDTAEYVNRLENLFQQIREERESRD